MGLKVVQEVLLITFEGSDKCLGFAGRRPTIGKTHSKCIFCIKDNRLCSMQVNVLVHGHSPIFQKLHCKVANQDEKHKSNKGHSVETYKIFYHYHLMWLKFLLIEN